MPLAPVVRQTSILSGGSLIAGQEIGSVDGTYFSIVGGDLVLYSNTGSPLWNAGITGASSLVMSAGGKLSAFDAGGNELSWSIVGTSGSYFQIQNGKALLLSTDGSTIQWSSVMTITTTSAPCVDLLDASGSLSIGQSVTSCDGLYTLLFQVDGSLSLLDSGMNVVWSTGPTTGTSVRLDAGFLNIYDSAGTSVWSTSSPSSTGSYLQVLDGYITITDGSTVYWSSLMDGGCMDILYAGNAIVSTELNLIMSCNGIYTVMLQSTDGNLVLYENSSNSLWSTGTSAGSTLQMYSNGTLILFDSSMNSIWSRNSEPNAYAKVTDDGKFVLRGASQDYIIAP